MDVQLAALKAHPQNYNQHSEDQVRRLMASLEQFGQRKPITTWRWKVENQNASLRT